MPAKKKVTKKVAPIPKGYHAVTPYLIIRGAAAALAFYKKAFGATELMRMPGPNGLIGHAEIKIGDSHIMLADEHVEMGYKGPETIGGTPVTIMLYVPNSDATFKRAVAGGATVKEAMEDKFYGDRVGSIIDPFGHAWHIGTHVRDVPPKQMAKAAAELAKKEGW